LHLGLTRFDELAEDLAISAICSPGGSRHWSSAAWSSADATPNARRHTYVLTPAGRELVPILGADRMGRPLVARNRARLRFQHQACGEFLRRR
jgi:hypothetical protein